MSRPFSAYWRRSRNWEKHDSARGKEVTPRDDGSKRESEKEKEFNRFKKGKRGVKRSPPGMNGKGSPAA